MMIDTRLLARIRDKKARLDARRPLPTAAVHRLEEQLAVDWTYNSKQIAPSLEDEWLRLREAAKDAP